MLKQPTEPMATELSAPELLRSAARLIERALIKLDMAEAPCPNCNARLFHDRDHSKAYEQLADFPNRLNGAAERIQNTTHRSSFGYAAAAKRKTIHTMPETAEGESRS